MTILKLPEINALSGQKWQMREDAIGKWNPDIQTMDKADHTIEVLDVIGEDYFTGEGVTAKKVKNALDGRSGDVTVAINSPGGDFFEGVAIYNLLRSYEGKVKIKVTGLAASAASVIAMAGDEIEIGKAGFLMIHNAWTIAVGNRHDMTDLAQTMAKFDASMAEVYAARSGKDTEFCAELMDDETWLTGAEAIEMGFASDFLPADQIKEEKSDNAANKKAQMLLDNALRAHYPDKSRKERRALLAEAKKGKQDAASDVMPRADELATALNGLLETIKAK